MEDNSSNDDEVQDPTLSPNKATSKKLKLNNGSSQDSFKYTVPSSSRDETVDSGISADKSESTSCEDRTAGPAAASEGPSNEVVNAAPSSSNVHTILLNIRRSKRGRNYRKRPGVFPDSDSHDSSRDSDDLSANENGQGSRRTENTNSETESDDLQWAIDLCTRDDDSKSGSSSSSESNNSYESDDIPMPSGLESDTDDEPTYTTSARDAKESEENKGKTPGVLLIEQPKHNYSIARELRNREMGLSLPRSAATADVIFEQKFYGSLHAVYRMERIHTLKKHKGCVNSINFHPEGQLLVSGSDDTYAIVWDWARRAPLQSIKTGHKANVFQTKFLHLNARSQLNIVTCARDGQVRLLQCPPSGGGPVCKRRLAAHARPAHKLHVCAAEPHLVVSAGEDGVVMQCDVRADHASRLFHVKERGTTIPLYSVSGHPHQPRELCVAGRDRFVRRYDTRHAARPVALYCPSTLWDQSDPKRKQRLTLTHLTCAVYNHDGSAILGSYNDEDIYLFDVEKDVYDRDKPSDVDGYTHRYSGHRNSATFKGVSFFGPRSQYVVSGSDCSHVYVWCSGSRALVQWLPGDNNGVVNCVEAHPRSPVLATSGLDDDIKIFAPRAAHDPTFDGMERVVRKNSMSQLRSPLFSDFLPSLYSAWRGENRLYADDELPSYGNIEFEGNVCTTM